MDQPVRQGLQRASVATNGTGLKDPVCGMAVTPKSFHSLEHSGRWIYFCSARCKERFVANPA